MVAVLAVLGGGLSAAAGGLVAAEPAAAATDSGSAVTVSGKGEFASLKMSVSQTRDLVDQVVNVTWTGGKPTRPQGVNLFGADYLQLMQCTGPLGDDGLPPRDQCVFGALADDRGGLYADNRQLGYDGLVDPLEPLTKPPATGFPSLPFTSVTTGPDGKPQTGIEGNNPFYGVNTTNEVPFARTGSDGMGQVLFETQTVRESPGLGCGAPSIAADPASPVRGCWLVAVPRGDHEVDGRPAMTVDTSGLLISSPLSTSNYANALVVPLQFQPVGLRCPIGSAERRVTGNELATAAVSAWQPQLCQTARAVFGYTQVPDSTVQTKLLSNDPGLGLLSRPLDDARQAASDARYAPVALSGLTLAFTINRQAAKTAPPAVKQKDGQLISELKLTPRLLAKLLTQSYQLGSSVSDPALEGNPFSLDKDPEFLAINPDFKPLALELGAGNAIGDIVVPLGQSDLYNLVWQYIAADPDARGFVAGAADPYGMKINPAYKDLALDRNDFPKLSQYCVPAGAGGNLTAPPLCTFDAHPYSNTLADGAQAISRGDSLRRTIFNPSAIPPGFRKNPRQPANGRALLALTDTATAVRLGLAAASLRNPAGQFVSPNTDSLLAAVATMKPTGAQQVLEADPRSAAPGQYPLTALSYAATVPSQLDPAAAADFSNLLTYAAGAGQREGTSVGFLPAGYAPLPAALRARTLELARALSQRAAPTTATPSASPGSPTASAAAPPGGGSAAGTVPLTVPQDGNDTNVGALVGAATTSRGPGAASPGPSNRAASNPGGGQAPVGGTGTGTTLPGAAGAAGGPPALAGGSATSDAGGTGGGSGAGGGSGGSGGAPAPSGAVPSSTPPATSGASDAPSRNAQGGLSAARLATPSSASGAARWALLVALLVGLAAAAAGPFLLRSARPT